MAPYCFADGRNKNSDGERSEVRESRFMPRLVKRFYALIFNPDAMTVPSKM
jgi:hypothetical protein